MPRRPSAPFLQPPLKPLKMSGVPEPTATVELTLFDALSAEVSFGTGWIVEGDIDLQKQEKALARVVNKWRLFAGRIQREVRERCLIK
jgi:hypothetical protein